MIGLRFIIVFSLIEYPPVKIEQFPIAAGEYQVQVMYSDSAINRAGDGFPILPAASAGNNTGSCQSPGWTAETDFNVPPSFRGTRL
jgi:hypothetical protein